MSYICRWNSYLELGLKIEKYDKGNFIILYNLKIKYLLKFEKEY